MKGTSTIRESNTRPFPTANLSNHNLTSLLAVHSRVRALRAGTPDATGKCVVYWMQRAQRGIDNPALNLAIDAGNAVQLPVLAVFGLTADYPGAQRRHYRFLVEGLVDASADLARRGVPLVVRLGQPDEVVARLPPSQEPRIVVGDENPVRIGCKWREQVLAKARDALLPGGRGRGGADLAAFPRRSIAARTIRPKIHRVWEEYLKPHSNPRARMSWTAPVPGR